jgi:hypothetical protein
MLCSLTVHADSDHFAAPAGFLGDAVAPGSVKTLILGTLVMYFGVLFFVSLSSAEMKHLGFTGRLALCFSSQILVTLSHVSFVTAEVKIVILKLLIFIIGSTFCRVYLLERQLRILFIIETEMEYHKQRHFFSMQTQFGDKLSRISDISWYLKTTPLDVQSIRKGVAQLQADNMVMTEATRNLKAKLLEENAQLAPIGADCRSCPLQGWGLNTEQNRVLEALYNHPPPSPQQRTVNSVKVLTYSESGPWPTMYKYAVNPLRHFRNRVFAIVCGGVGLISILCFCETYYRMGDVLPWHVLPSAFIALFAVTCGGLYLRKANNIPSLARQCGTFLLLASQTMSLFVFCFVPPWNAKDLGNFDVDMQYLNALVMFFSAHAFYRLSLQTQFCDFTWYFLSHPVCDMSHYVSPCLIRLPYDDYRRFAFLYNFAVGLVGWLVCSGKLWSHPCFRFMQVCACIIIIGTALSRYDHEKVCRKCFLAERINQQGQANAFFTVMHDFNQPCNVITNCCDLLLTPLSASETADILNVLTVSVSWQTQLVKSAWIQEQLLENASLMPSYSHNVIVETLMAECLTICKGYFFGGGLPVQLKCEIAAEVPKAVTIDRDWVKRFILNLVSNSIKFTLEGSITIRVGTYTTRSEKDPARVETGLCFSVADTGSGIPEHKVNRLFCKFEQLHDINRGGTG